MNEWGYTNDPKYLTSARAFIAAAENDGWIKEQTYPNESISSACKLHRDGFIISAILRENVGKWKYEVSISGWAPDRLCIAIPTEYDFDKIINQPYICGVCSKKVEKTFRYSFAGRCCADCVEKARAEHEKPGWCD